MAVNGRALAENCSDYNTPQRVLAGMKSTDEIVKMDAQSCGFKSEDKTTRGVVVKSIISGLNQFIFNLEPPEDDLNQAQDIQKMPTFATSSVKWADDGRIFTGTMVGGGEIRGQSLSESLSLNFYAMRLHSLKSGTQGDLLSCSAILGINVKTGRIEGPLHCVGLQDQYILVLAS